MAVLIIETAGSPYEVGYQHGQQAAAQIRAAYQRFCRYEFGDAAAREALASTMEANVAGRQPEALDEMRGIAAGADLAYAQIRDLNFSIELWCDTWLAPPARLACTLVGLANTPDGLLIGKTMDVVEGDEAYMLVQRIQPAEGYRFVHVTYAGTIWTDGGVNEPGLAQSNSALETSARNWQGFPIFLMARNLLQYCADVPEAVSEAMESDAINFGSNILLADANNDLVVVERSVTRQAVRRRIDPQTQPLFATNHSLTPELEDVLGGSQTLLDNSHERFDRLTELSPLISTSLDGLQNLFRDHTRPGGFCQHGQGDLHTIGAFIAAPRLRQLWVAHGPPCQNPFTPVSLDK